MAESKMQLEDWLDDLCVRFIVNLPREELESVERICFQVEEAQWFYEDFIRPLDPNLPSLSLRAFALRIFQHCPLMSQWSHYHHSTAFSEFLAYKTRVPVRGAILLNQEMDEVVLVKGWKKGASWSFPRGKINKDEKDLDCAIREVYEETGFDIKAAGLVKDEKHIKHIEINMREQNMRLYVFSGVPRETHFEPRTRKEISRIEWVKLSDLPTLKKAPAHKKNKQAEADNQSNLAGNASKFYMVAPFLVPLKKWIARQKKLEIANNPNLHPPVAETSAGEGFTEEEGLADNNAAPVPGPGEEWFPSDLPEVSLTDDPSAHLKRLLNISDLAALQPSQASFASQRHLQPQASSSNKGSALLDLLRKGNTPVAGPEPRSSAAPEPAQPSMPQASFAELSPAPQAHVAQVRLGQGGPLANLQTGPMNWPPDAPPPHGQFSYAPGSVPPREQPQHINRNNPQPYPPISFPQQPNIGRYIGSHPPQMQNPPQMGPNAVVPPLPPQMPPNFGSNVERRHTPAPYQRTGDPQFSQAAQSSNNHVFSVPPASKLPPPKLTSHSLALLNVFKGQNDKPAISEELPARENGDKLSVRDKTQQQDKLLNLLRKSTSPADAPNSSLGRAELAASSTRGNRRHDKETNMSNGPVELQSKGRGHAEDKDITGARVSGPLNLPDFEGVARSNPKIPSTRPVPKAEPKPKSNIVILPRPKTAEKEVSAATQETRSPPSAPKRNAKFPEPTKPFLPKILRRPVKEDMEASLPSDTVTVSAFSLPSKDQVLERERKPSADLNLDRRPSQTAAQKEALLSLFGKPNLPAQAPPAPNVETSHAAKSPPRSTIISPVEKSSLPPSRKDSMPQHSRIGSVSPTTSAEAQPVNRNKATSPVNKAFLLGYLEGVAKGKQ